jgi:hypothetical protein
MDAGKAVEVRWWRAKPGPGGPLAEFSAANGHAFEHDSARSKNAGIGAEAVYGPSPDGMGGSLAFRTATGAAALVGTASKDGLVALAKLASARM